jgi:hypothetical protein
VATHTTDHRGHRENRNTSSRDLGSISACLSKLGLSAAKVNAAVRIVRVFATFNESTNSSLRPSRYPEDNSNTDSAAGSLMYSFLGSWNNQVGHPG